MSNRFGEFEEFVDRPLAVLDEFVVINAETVRLADFEIGENAAHITVRAPVYVADKTDQLSRDRRVIGDLTDPPFMRKVDRLHLVNVAVYAHEAAHYPGVQPHIDEIERGFRIRCYIVVDHIRHLAVPLPRFETELEFYTQILFSGEKTRVRCVVEAVAVGRLGVKILREIRRVVLKDDELHASVVLRRESEHLLLRFSARPVGVVHPVGDGVRCRHVSFSMTRTSGKKQQSGEH